MAYGGGATAAAAAAAALAQAVKASGVIVKLEPEDFVKILNRTKTPLVITARAGFRNKQYEYLTSFKGFVFYTKSGSVISLPGDAEVIASEKIWIPS